MKLLLGRDCPPVLAKISNDLTRPDLPRIVRLAWMVWLKVQCRFIDRWVAMDDQIAAELRHLLGQVDHVVVPSPAIDSLPVRPPLRVAPTGSAPRRYVAVGRLAAQKDLVTLVRAFAPARSFGDHLTILGDGPHRRRLESWVRSLGLEDAVTFAGHTPDAASRIGQYDTLLLSSRYEGVPAAMIEGMVAGLRVVSTDCGVGVRSLLGDGALGRITPRGDIRAFATGMLTAFDAPQDEVRARLHAYTLDASAPLYAQIFANLAAKARRVGPTRRQPHVLGVEA